MCSTYSEVPVEDFGGILMQTTEPQITFIYSAAMKL